MEEKINKLKEYFDELFSEDIFNTAYIEIDDCGETILAANENGFIYLIALMLDLCQKKSEHYHYHLDEAGMVAKCDKGLIIQYTKSPW